VGAAFQERRSILLDVEYATSPYMTAWARDYGIQSEYAVPLVVRRRVVGVLSVMYGHTCGIDPGLQRVIELTAKQIAPTLIIMGLLAEAEHSVNESVTLAKLIRDTAAHVDVDVTCARITETACRLVGADYGIVGVLEQDGVAHSYGAWGTRVSQWKAGNKQHLFAGMSTDNGHTLVLTNLPVRSDAAREEFAGALAEGARTIMLIPLIGEGTERLGSLLLGWRVDVEPTLRQIALVETLSRHAVAVIMHARAIERIVGQQREHSREEHYRALAEHATDLVMVFDASLIVRYAGSSYRSVLGWEPAAMIARRLFDFVLPDDIPMVERQILSSRLSNSGRIESFRFRVRHGDGSTRVLQACGVNRSDDPVIAGWLLHSHDVTAGELQILPGGSGVSEDSLAKLLDRGAIEETLHSAAAEAHAHRSSLALIMVDLDRFGSITGDVRFEITDRLLREVGDRLRSVLRGGDRIGRLGADEFLIIAPHADEVSARSRADMLLHIMEEPFHIDGDEHRFAANIGITLYPAHGLDARTLLRHAGIAVRTAKRSRLGCALYDMESDRSASARVLAVSALRDAIAHNELMLHYQPIFDVRGGQVVQAEALCRWPSAPSGLEAPDTFIPLAEHAGLIGALTQWVVHSAIDQWARWGSVAPASLSINISMEDLADPELADRFERIFEKTGVEASRICLELTESALLIDVEHSVRTLERLVRLGVTCSIDDFGTGYTSLSYLKRFPVRELKIDRSFVIDLENDTHDRTIVRSVIDLAHGLGLGVVAEGVETLGALDLLRGWGCDRAQGRILAPPMPPEAFAARFFQESFL
jgi:diguanylate cyclase (GGDEF)-like protein/PAS domain S-box-containing protein